MTRLLLACAAVALLTGCATAPAAQPLTDGDRSCNIVVTFGSYAMGIDGETFREVDAYVEGRKDLIPSAVTRAWGREGEKTLCLTTSGPMATRRVYDAIEILIPRTARRGPVEIKDDTGRSFATDMPAEMKR